MKNILIYLADDDQEDRDLFLDALKDIPIETEVKQFENGIDLMDKLFSTDNLPDVIFLDLFMPIMDGFECLTDIRNFEQFSEIQIVVYSSVYRNREVKQLRQDGANQYLQKPHSFGQLQTLLKKSLKSIQNKPSTRSEHKPFLSLV
ncbi:response regulator [Maribacter sp. X9]|uniref:response regulator n=1 Tax=Maribacter sp. X9 TaxID=3402159 RepID=UPI003AF3E94A